MVQPKHYFCFLILSVVKLFQTNWTRWRGSWKCWVGIMWPAEAEEIWFLVHMKLISICMKVYRYFSLKMIPWCHEEERLILIIYSKVQKHHLDVEMIRIQSVDCLDNVQSQRSTNKPKLWPGHQGFWAGIQLFGWLKPGLLTGGFSGSHFVISAGAFSVFMTIWRQIKRRQSLWSDPGCPW